MNKKKKKNNNTTLIYGNEKEKLKTFLKKHINKITSHHYSKWTVLNLHHPQNHQTPTHSDNYQSEAEE